MKNAFVKAQLCLLTVIGMTTPGMLRAGCLPSAPTGYTVPFSLVSLNNYSTGNPFASYVAGAMTVQNYGGPSGGGVILLPGTEYRSTHDERLFSNRTASVGFLLTQPFDVHQPDNVFFSVNQEIFLPNPTVTLTP